MITQRVDETHDVLGFTSGWIEALAEHVDRLDVLTAFEGTYGLPDNVHVQSFGKERGYSKPRRILSFERHCLRYAQKVDVVFAHMIPNYVLASWPWFRSAGVPIVLWYAHGTVSWNLRLAHRLVDHVVTPTPDSFRLSSDKLLVTGHGIDTDRFAPNGSPTDRHSLLGVGRVMPVKNFEVLIDAVAELDDRNRDVTLRIAGDSRGDRAYFESIKHYAADAGVGERVNFLGSIPHDEIVDEYRRAGAFLNASATGSLDKTEIEALACGTPTVSSNDSFVELVNSTGLDEEKLIYEQGNAQQLADRVAALVDLDDETYADLGEQGRSIVEERHSVTSLMASIADVFTAVRRQRTGPGVV